MGKAVSLYEFTERPEDYPALKERIGGLTKDFQNRDSRIREAINILAKIGDEKFIQEILDQMTKDIRIGGESVYGLAGGKKYQEYKILLERALKIRMGQGVDVWLRMLKEEMQKISDEHSRYMAPESRKTTFMKPPQVTLGDSKEFTDFPLIFIDRENIKVDSQFLMILSDPQSFGVEPRSPKKPAFEIVANSLELLRYKVRSLSSRDFREVMSQWGTKEEDFRNLVQAWEKLRSSGGDTAMTTDLTELLSKVKGLDRLGGNQAVMEFVYTSIRDLGIDPTTVQVVDKADGQTLLKEGAVENPAKDIARLEERTTVATENPEDARRYGYWKKSSEIKPVVWNKLKGSYKRKKVYVIPYLIWDNQVGIQITDSRYVALHMIRMEKVGKAAIDYLNKQQDKTKFVKGIHSIGDLDNIKRGENGIDERYFVFFPDEWLILSYGSDFRGDVLVYGLKSPDKDKAQMAKGGIDLNTSGMKWNVRKEDNGVEMNNDPAMIERIRREGIDSLSPVIFRITPVTSIWPLVGLQSPAQAERLGGA